MKNASRFIKGCALYTCRLCGRSTRQTGRGDNENVGLCAECYDLCGLENMIHDGHSVDIGMVHWLRGLIVTKGGNPDRAFDLSLLGVDHA